MTIWQKHYIQRSGPAPLHHSLVYLCGGGIGSGNHCRDWQGHLGNHTLYAHIRGTAYPHSWDTNFINGIRHGNKTQQDSRTAMQIL